MNTSHQFFRATIIAVLALATGNYTLAGDRATDVSSYSWYKIRPTVPLDQNI